MLTPLPLLHRAWIASLALIVLVPSQSLMAQHSAPYRVRIVLHVARHRLLTDVFKQQVKRQLGDGLRAALGDLARVEVMETHPRLRQVKKLGLKKGLEDWKEVSRYKTHFVFISFSRSTYHVQTRQHDGPTGTVSPVVRKDSTRDRAFVARLAALLVQKDLGLLGTVMTNRDAEGMVKVQLQGANLGVPLDRWVKKGAVFAVIRQGQSPARGGLTGVGTGTPPLASAPGRKIPWCYLQVRTPPDKDGVCEGKLWHRYVLEGSVPGLRCIQLGTVRAPLRLRMMRRGQGRTLKPMNHSLRVRIRQNGFTGEEATALRTATTRLGLLDTSDRGKKFGPLAFVSTKSDKTVPATIPIPIVADCTVVVEIATSQQNNSLFPYRLNAFQRSVYEARLVQSQIFKEITDMASRGKPRAEMLKRARQGLARSQADHKRLSEERAQLLKQAAKLPGSGTTTLKREEARLNDLKDGAKRLTQFIARQEKIEREEKDPRRKEILRQVESARLLEAQAEIGQALDVYNKLLQANMTDPALKKFLSKIEVDNLPLPEYVTRLKKEWQVKGEEHRKARAFIYNTYPTLGATQLNEHFADVLKYFEECKKVGDAHTCRKLFRETIQHAEKLGKRLKELRPDLNVDDEKPAKLINEIAPKLAKLGQDVKIYLDSLKTP